MVRWVVVGGGAAGCVAAARLSERSNADVVLLERGLDHGPLPVDGDVGALVDDATRTATDDVVRRAGTEPVPYLRGAGLGGSSLINGGVVTTTWATTGHRLPLEQPWADGAVGGALLASDRSATRVRLVRQERRRVTVADAYLRPVLERSNLEVRTGERVERVELAGRAAVGVVTAAGEAIRADRVVLCAGAIATPTILLRSGVDTPGVGGGIQDHPSFTITLQLRPDSIDPASPTFSVSADRGSCQVLTMNQLPARPDLGALVVALTVPLSTGSIRLADLEGPPVVALGELTDPVDGARLALGVAEVIALLDHPAWDAVVEAVYIDDVGTPVSSIAGSPARALEWVRDHPGPTFHAAGSCREGVVTDGGVVRGYEGLYAADASALPGVPRYDPYVAVVANAERLVRNWT